MGNSNVDSLVCDTGGVTTATSVVAGTTITAGTGLTVTTGGITLGSLNLTIVGQASETYDAGSIDDGNEEVGELTVSGATLGDYAIASHTVDVADLAITAAVTAADTVTYQLLNNTGGAIDLASGTVKVAVLRIA